MRKFLLYIISALVFLSGSLFATQAAEAAYFKFDKSSISVSAGDTFDIAVIVDAGTDQVQSADIYVTYDSTALTAQSVTPGTYFPSVLKTIASGQVYIAGIPQQQNQPVTGTGTVATINFKATKAATLSFDCDNSTIVKYDPNSPNILVCSQNQGATVLVGGQSPVVTSTPAPTAASSGNNSNSSNSSSSSSSSTVQPTPSVLPTTGFFDNTLRIALPGLILLSIGLLARFVL